MLALLKKEKPLKELQQCMSEQLDVFLGEQTAPFLAELFEVIGSEVYLQGSQATQPNSGDAEPKQEPALKDAPTADKAASASKPAIDHKQSRRVSPPRASDSQTNNDTNTDYVSTYTCPNTQCLSDWLLSYVLLPRVI